MLMFHLFEKANTFFTWQSWLLARNFKTCRLVRDEYNLQKLWENLDLLALFSGFRWEHEGRLVHHFHAEVSMIKMLERFLLLPPFWSFKSVRFWWNSNTRDDGKSRHAGLSKKEFRDDKLVNNTKIFKPKWETLKTLVFKETCDYYIFAFIHFVGE